MDGMSREHELAHALAAVRKRIEQAAESAGRNAADVELVPVTKFFPATDVAILSRLGCRGFGESREQEAASKSVAVAKLVDASVRWHMVGQIQRNKARSIARWAYAVHSVGSNRVVAALDRTVGAALESGERTDPLRVFVQLSLDGDVARGGVDVRSSDLVDQVCAA